MEIQEGFENAPVEAKALPSLEEVHFTGLEREYLYLRLTSWGIFFFLALAVLLVVHFTADMPLLLALSIYGGVLLVVLLMELLGFKIKGYALRQRDITYKSGLLFFHMTSVPFNRIQHSEVSQGPLGRLFDLATVNIYTAGGSSSDLSISGLEKEQAHKLREHIVKQAASYA
jgi:membrane protein YdbS with pleckstrin-like domain